MLMVNGVTVDEVHIERAKALQAYARDNGMKVPTIKSIVRRADSLGLGSRTNGFDAMDNGEPFTV